MDWIFRLADEITVRRFLQWRYEPPYDVYNADPGNLEADVRYFRDPEILCYGIEDPSGELLAYCTFGVDARVAGGDYSTEALDIGLGVRPDLTGQGRGIAFVEVVLAFARRSFAPKAYRVTIAQFNQRAQKVWRKAGFRQVQRFEREPDGLPFVVFVRDA
jgi:ribosomal-protein-alanine N-acetyltransferase